MASPLRVSSVDDRKAKESEVQDNQLGEVQRSPEGKGIALGVVRQGHGLDIGHVRNLKDNNPATWVAYNRLRGQYMSALEGAIPERFFNNPAQCNVQGSSTAPNPALPDCPQGISAIKALAIAASAGQKIYTITAAVY